MKIKTFAYILVITSILSCNDTKKNDVDFQQKIISETPKVLEENKDYNLTSFSKRYDSDIILKLYDEAIKKSLKLENLNAKITNMSQVKHDSLAEYSAYSRTNNDYWLVANRYINQLQDSILKKSTLEIFKNIERKYETKISNYKQKLIIINEKTISLNDQLIILKLIITEPMIRNYQINETPDIQKLENIINEYDKLLKETEEYT